MLAEERRRRVLVGGRQGCIALAELAQAISVSESTIRRVWITGTNRAW